MRPVNEFPTVVDLAYEIIAMDQELQQLRGTNRSLTELVHMHNESMTQNLQSSRKFMGDIFLAVLDPNSAISLGLDAKKKQSAEVRR